MKLVKSLVASLSIAFLAGCAFTDASLSVAYDEAHASKGPISREDHGPIRVSEFADSRRDKKRIGYKRNGFGQKTADITTEVPVTDIVRDALSKALEANGQTLANTDDRIQINGEVTEFWFEADMNFWTVKFMGSVAADMEFIDSTTGQTFHSERYLGHYEVETAGGLEGTWTDVMNLALEKMIDAIMKDGDLAKKVRELPQAQSASLAVGQ